MTVIGDALKVRSSQGKQYIPDVRTANPIGFRGLPVINNSPCENGCTACVESCPTTAIELAPFGLGLGRCVFCDECARVCPQDKLQFTTDYRLATTDRNDLIVREGNPDLTPIESTQAIRKVFGRSLKLRSVSAGGCNGCEQEINATTNVNFDMGRYGIDILASPRHTDGIILSGPITEHMASALERCYQAIPEPKIVIAVGACTISGGMFEESTKLDRSFLDRCPPTLYVAGCPPHPLSIVNGILDLIGHADGKW